MKFNCVSHTFSNYGDNMMNTGYGNLIFYDSTNLKHCKVEYTNLNYYQFETQNRISMLPVSKNSKFTLCKILDNTESD